MVKVVSIMLGELKRKRNIKVKDTEKLIVGHYYGDKMTDQSVIRWVHEVLGCWNIQSTNQEKVYVKTAHHI